MHTHALYEKTNNKFYPSQTRDTWKLIFAATPAAKGQGLIHMIFYT